MRFPKPLVDQLDINIFADSNHGHNKLTGRSITGTMGCVGSTPVLWRAERQPSVHTSTFGADFTALKTAVEDENLRYCLRYMQVRIRKPTNVMVDNIAVVLNASNPGSTLNKKHIALAYHFVREHVAGKYQKRG